jgi:hypothetical protein
MSTTTHRHYRSTESKYKGGATEMYVTYDLAQGTRSGGSAVYPKVKRVYIAGDVQDWKVGTFPKRTGRTVHGVRIEYTQSRARYHRDAYTAERGATRYGVEPASVAATSQRFVQVVELPERARNIHFYDGTKPLPEKYRTSLQDVR